MMSSSNLAEHAFRKALVEADKAAEREAGFTGKALRQMIADHGGIGAAKRLLQPAQGGRIHDGLVELALAGRIDLSAEAVVLKPRFRKLFSEAERAEARRRLDLCAFASRAA